MRLAIILGMSSAGVAVLNCLLMIINWSLAFDGGRSSINALEVITGIQTFFTYPAQTGLMLVFFIMFFKEENKK